MDPPDRPRGKKKRAKDPRKLVGPLRVILALALVLYRFWDDC